MLDVRTLVPEGNQKTRNSKYSVNEGLQRLIILAKKSFLIYKEKYFFYGNEFLNFCSKALEFKKWLFQFCYINTK